MQHDLKRQSLTYSYVKEEKAPRQTKQHLRFSALPQIQVDELTVDQCRLYRDLKFVSFSIRVSCLEEKEIESHLVGNVGQLALHLRRYGMVNSPNICIA